MLMDDKAPLNILFSIIIHVAARDSTGEFERTFIKNTKKTTPEYRKTAKKTWKKLQNEFFRCSC
mgnify:CR=1 FL=1